jgi:metal-dependent amidase/aminoacylase/carboxypeptidase family protein
MPANPELGFKEFETAKLVAQAMSEFGRAYESGLGITGVKAILKGKKPTFKVTPLPGKVLDRAGRRRPAS